MQGADVFLGVSGPDLLPPETLELMAENPIVFACSNPDPEIKPELAHAVRKDLIMATGRSDYPNQVNNVLCFPFIFRGALDVRAKAINDEMKVAAVEALRSVSKEEVPEDVLTASNVNLVKTILSLNQWTQGFAKGLPEPLHKRQSIQALRK
jgi:malate dehydrogenase (oxaloacetate-decarboxylating)(NADP+)